MVMAGKEISSSGSVLIGHNNDLSGTEFSYVQKFPRTHYDSVVFFKLDNGLKLEIPEITFKWMVLQTEKGYKEGDAIAINEYKVAIAGGVSLKKDRNMKAREADPLIEKGVSGAIRYLAIQQARSARECVKIIGNYYNTYGISYPSGVTIADPNEIWYMETGGGKHWAAIKLPNDACWVQANSYRIKYVNPNNNNMMCSPGLLEFAKQKGLWNPDSSVFSFSDAFGGRMEKTEKYKNYNSHRLWRATKLLDPSLKVTPDQKNLPLHIRPGNKVGIKDMMNILRDEYRNTNFDPYLIDSLRDKERPIASEKCVHTSIVQLRSDFPANIGAIMWVGMGSPVTTPYIPLYLGINEIPDNYQEKSNEQAFNIFKKIADQYYKEPLRYRNKFPSVWENLENKIIREQRNIDHMAYRLYRIDPSQSKHFITVNVATMADEGIDIANEFLESE
jgi:dipeptidase